MGPPAARRRNVTTSILINDLYAAVSSADNSHTIVRNGPLSFLLLGHNLSGPFFRFYCPSSSSHRATITVITTLTSTSAILRSSSVQEKCLKVRMHPWCFRKPFSTFSQFGERHDFSCFQFCHPANIYGNMFLETCFLVLPGFYLQYRNITYNTNTTCNT